MEGQQFFAGLQQQQQQQQQQAPPQFVQQPQFPPNFQYGYVPHHQPFPYIAAAPAAPPPPPPPLLPPAAAAAAPAFFNSWEPPPIPVPPPADVELQKRIDKLVEFSAKNGPVFEALIKDKQRDDPGYAFLFGADGHSYYKYKLWITLNPHLVAFNPAVNLVNPALGIPAPAGVINPSIPIPPPQVQLHVQHSFPPVFYEQTIQQPPQQMFEAPPPALIPQQQMIRSTQTPMPVEIAAELRSMLDNLTGTKDSIKSARTWIMHRSAFAPALAEALRDRVTGSDNVETQLHVLYLVNDILFNSLQLRVNLKEPDTEALAFRPVLSSILGAITQNPDAADADRDQVEKMLQFWGTKEVYDAETVKSLEREMKNEAASFALLPAAHKQWQKAAALEQKGEHQPPAAPGVSNSPSVAALFPALAPFLPQTAAVQPASRSDHAQYPHFPPGLIPGMVRKMQIGSGVPYSPLSPLDIPAVIPTGGSSEYILDRVSKFFKDIGEPDPLGGSYRQGPEPEGRGARIPPPPQLQVDPESGTLSDGSLEHRPGMTSTGRLGLGASADPNEATPYDDVYTSYRKQRSTNYHTSMSARAAAAR